MHCTAIVWNVLKIGRETLSHTKLSRLYHCIHDLCEIWILHVVLPSWCIEIILQWLKSTPSMHVYYIATLFSVSHLRLDKTGISWHFRGINLHSLSIISSGMLDKFTIITSPRVWSVALALDDSMIVYLGKNERCVCIINSGLLH